MMKHLRALLIVVFPLIVNSQNQIIIKNVSIVDVKGNKIDKNKTVTIKGNRIISISSRTIIPQHAEVIDARGKFLIPGFWDMHAHTLTDKRYVYSFPLLIANGVTGVRDMGNNLSIEEVNQIRSDVANGKILGPRFGALTYRILDGPGTQIGPATAVATVEEARAIVKQYKQMGADFVKPYNLLSPDVYMAIVDEAEKNKILVEGHVPFSMTAEKVSDLKQKSIEHNFDVLVSCSTKEDSLRREIRKQPSVWGQAEAIAAVNYDETKANKLYTHLAKNKTWSCPTITFYKTVWWIANETEVLKDPRLKYIPKSQIEAWHLPFQRLSHNTVEEYRKNHYEMRSRIVKEMHDAGVQIIAGTDTGSPFSIPGFSLHDELQALVDAGLSNIEALRASTLNAAKFLGKEKDLGSIEKGKIADLVLLEANPLENISNTKKIFAVIVNGKYLDRQSLDELLAGAEKNAAR